MSPYVHGKSLAAKQAHDAEIRARKKAAELARIEAELDARIKARKEALKYQPKVRTYRPTPEAQAAWEKFQANNTNPFGDRPYDGYRRLREATAEAAAWDAINRQVAA